MGWREVHHACDMQYTCIFSYISSRKLSVSTLPVISDKKFYINDHLPNAQLHDAPMSLVGFCHVRIACVERKCSFWAELAHPSLFIETYTYFILSLVNSAFKIKKTFQSCIEKYQELGECVMKRIRFRREELHFANEVSMCRITKASCWYLQSQLLRREHTPALHYCTIVLLYVYCFSKYLSTWNALVDQLQIFLPATKTHREHCIALHCSALHCSALHCIVLPHV
jgi:hypothetical protein